jgi:putative membrane protein
VSPPQGEFGRRITWSPERPHLRASRVVVAWVISALALLAAAQIVPGAHVDGFWGALLVAAVVGILNAVLPPIVAALRLPFTLVLGFLLVLVANALMLLAADALTEGTIVLDSFWAALGVALVASAVSIVLQVIVGASEDDT